MHSPYQSLIYSNQKTQLQQINKKTTLPNGLFVDC